jgi:Flp pilus assembly protein TadG
MRKLDRCGTAALEFTFVAVPLFFLMFVMFDLGRYAITMQSLRTLADAGARRVMIKCETPDAISAPRISPSGCTCTNTSTSAWCLSTTQRQAVAPFLYYDKSPTPTLTVTANTTSTPQTLTVTATQLGFTMITPFWALNTPSASTSIPYN